MTDKEFAAQQSRVQKAFDKWKSPTGLDGWVVCHTWYRDGSAGEEYRKATARADCSWEYIHVMFHWNLQSIAVHDDKEVDRIVRHEICHVLVNEMREWSSWPASGDGALKHEERTVSRLASILLWCRQEGQEDAKKVKKR